MTEKIFQKYSKKHEYENVSGTEESDVVQPSTHFAIVDLNDSDIAEKTTLYIQVNHVFENPKIKNPEAEQKT